MREIPLTRGKIALVDDQDFDWLIGFPWCAIGSSQGSMYARRRLEDGKHLRMHQAVAERMGIVGLVDHRDRNSFNNQRYNLRPCTPIQNAQNRGKRKNSSSPYKGVSWATNKGKWFSRITVNKKLIYLGYFDDPIDAAKRYDDAARESFGEFACLNFEQPPVFHTLARVEPWPVPVIPPAS